MELTHFDIEAMSVKPHKLQLKHPRTNEPLEGTFIQVIGAESERFKRIMANSGHSLKGEEDAYAFVKKSAEIAAYLVVGWENLEIDSEPVEYSEEKALHIFSQPGWRWISEQVILAASDDSFFFKDCPSS